MDSTQQNILNLNNQNLLDEQLFDKLIESNQIFLQDHFLVQLFEKSINLGFSWDLVKQAFRKYLLSLSPHQIDLYHQQMQHQNIDFKQFIDEERFIEQVILLSIQMDANVSSLNGKNMQNMDDFNYEEDEFNQFKQQQQQQQHQQHQQQQQQEAGKKTIRAITNVAASNVLNKLNSNQNMINTNNNNKSASISKLEQEHQEFVKESMNRINDKSNLRPIIIDSEDVGCSANKQLFTLTRVKQVVDYFEKRNHKIYVIMSLKRKEQINSNNNSSNLLTSSNTNLNQIDNQDASNSSASATTQDQILLKELDEKNLVHYTPYKRIGCKSIMYNVESAMLQFAASKKAIIVSNNNFRRFLNQSDEYKQVIEERVLMYSFIDDTFMPAEDPLGKNGPSLNNFLRFEPFANQQYMKRCPYKKKCTYGSKCKFWHPERAVIACGPGLGSDQTTNQIFKTAHQFVIEEAQEQKSKFKIILNRQNTISTNNTNNSIANSNRSPSPLNNNLIRQLESVTNKYLQANTLTSSFIQDNSNLINNFKSSNNQLLRSMGPNDPRNSIILNPNSSSSSSASTCGNNLSSNFKAPKFDTDLINNDLIMKSSQLKLDDTNIQKQQKEHQFTCSSFSSTQSTNMANAGDLRSMLMSKFNQDIVDKVLNDYKDETDIEKLIFLAEGFSFDF